MIRGGRCGQVLGAAESSPVLVKYAALFAGLLLVVAFGVRPALSRARQAPAAAGKAIQNQLSDGVLAAAQATLKHPDPVELDPERIRAAEIFEQVSGHLKREPSQSSRLLQSWIHSE